MMLKNKRALMTQISSPQCLETKEKGFCANRLEKQYEAHPEGK